MKKFFILIFGLSFCTASYADNCSEKLLEQDEITFNSKTDKQAFSYSLVCSTSYTESNTVKGGHLKGSFFEVVDGDTEYDETHYNKFKEENCNNELSAEQHLNTMEFYSHKALNPKGVDAYLACKREQTFSCWAKPSGHNIITFVVRGGGGFPDSIVKAVSIEGIESENDIVNNPIEECSGLIKLHR